MFLIEMPLVFSFVAFIVGCWFIIFDIKEKLMGRQFVLLKMGFISIAFSIVISTLWILFVKYTFVEGIILNCAEIKFFC